MRKMQQKRFPQDNSAVAAVEFALIIPVFLAILMGVLEFGLIMFTFNAAENAARDVARQLASNRISTTSAALTAKDELPNWVASSATVNVSQSTPGSPATNQFTVDIYVPAIAASPTGFLKWAYQTLTLRASVTMQQEIPL